MRLVAWYNTGVYFKNNYETEWLKSDLAKKMNRDIDDSDVLSGDCIMSPVLGQISPERLSGGVKTLLLILNEPDRIFNASACGDNCAKWILEIGKQKDITINLRHMMSFGKDTKFEIKIQNGGEIVHSMKELVTIAHDYLTEKKQENGGTTGIRTMTIGDYDRVYDLWIHTPGMGLNTTDDSREGSCIPE